MDETTFEIDQKQVRATGRKFPARRLVHPPARPSGDVSYLTEDPDFCQHAWDEGGH